MHIYIAAARVFNLRHTILSSTHLLYKIFLKHLKSGVVLSAKNKATKPTCHGLKEAPIPHSKKKGAALNKFECYAAYKKRKKNKCQARCSHLSSGWQKHNHTHTTVMCANKNNNNNWHTFTPTNTHMRNYTHTHTRRWACRCWQRVENFSHAKGLKVIWCIHCHLSCRADKLTDR